MDKDFPDGMLESIEEFLDKVHPHLEPGRNVYQEVFNTPMFFPLQRQAELAWMMRKARERTPRVVMEIGADKGGGLYHWCQSLAPTVERVVACEIRGTPYATAFERAFPHLDFFWMPCPSRDMVEFGRLRRWLESDSLDCLFIDGDKGTFWEDLVLYRSLMVKDRGLVFMHDIQDSAPRAAFDRAGSRYRTELYIDKTDWYDTQERQSLGLLPRGSHDGWLRHWAGLSCGVGVVYL